MTGSFNAIQDFDPGVGVVNLNPATGPVFIAKYTSAGAYVLAFNVAEGGPSTRSAGIAVDGGGNMYITGHMPNDADFDPGPGTAILSASGPPIEAAPIYVAKYSSAGAYVWAFKVPSPSCCEERSNAIAVGTNGNVHITGTFTGTQDFDPGPGTANVTAAGGTYDAFVAQYRSNGSFLWAFGIGSPTTHDVGTGIAVDALNNVYVTGYVGGTVDFDPGAGTALLSSSGSDDVFLAEYSSLGSFGCAGLMGGTASDQGYGIALSGYGVVHLAGMFDSTPADFDPGPGTANLSSSGAGDIFFAKYDICIGDPLPVELLSFTAKANRDRVDLSWTTASEFNNAYFEVERSADAHGWVPILRQPGAGNSMSLISYSDVDGSPLNGTSYYRLRQVDFDRASTYSGVVAVNFSALGGGALELWPNPSGGQVVYIAIQGCADQPVEVTIQDVNGRVVATTTIPSTACGKAQLPMITTPGAYAVRAVLPGRSLSGYYIVD